MDPHKVSNYVPGTRIVSLIGMRYGRLTVTGVNRIEKHPRDKFILQVVFYECLCECGENVVRSAPALKSKSKYPKSCGREPRGLRRSTGTGIGTKHGKLTVVDISEERTTTNQIRCVCLCECGNTVHVRAASLKSGHSLSCGCLSKGEGIRLRGWRIPQETARLRRERERGLDAKWNESMTAIIKYKQDECVICSSTNRLAIDHVRPISKGYSLEPGNAVVLCQSCNSSKSNKALEELAPSVAEKILEKASEFLVEWERYKHILDMIEKLSYITNCNFLEDGGIRVKHKNGASITMTGEGGLEIKAPKGVKVTSEGGCVTVHGEKDVNIKSGRYIKLNCTDEESE